MHAQSDRSVHLPSGKFPFPGLEGLGEEEIAVALRNGLEAERRRRKRIGQWHEGLYKVGD